MRKAPSFGITWNGNLAFSQYWEEEKLKDDGLEEKKEGNIMEE